MDLRIGVDITGPATLLEESVCRVLCRLQGNDPDAVMDANLEECIPEMRAWRGEIAWAREVIKAIRIPTEGMVEAGLNCANASGVNLSSIWTAMADRAIVRD